MHPSELQPNDLAKYINTPLRATTFIFTFLKWLLFGESTHSKSEFLKTHTELKIYYSVFIEKINWILEISCLYRFYKF